MKYSLLLTFIFLSVVFSFGQTHNSNWGINLGLNNSVSSGSAFDEIKRIKLNPEIGIYAEFFKGRDISFTTGLNYFASGYIALVSTEVKPDPDLTSYNCTFRFVSLPLGITYSKKAFFLSPALEASYLLAVSTRETFPDQTTTKYDELIDSNGEAIKGPTKYVYGARLKMGFRRANYDLGLQSRYVKLYDIKYHRSSLWELGIFIAIRPLS